MPSALRYVDPNNTYRSSMLGLLTSSDTVVRSKWFDKVWSYYNGDHPQQLEKHEDEPDNNVTINMIKQTLDRTVGFLFPNVPKFETDPDESKETEEEIYIRELWQANGGLELLHEMAINGGISGDVYVRLLPAVPEEGIDYIQILPINPGSIQTYWDANNIKRPLWHELTWSVTDEFDVQIDYLVDFVNEGKRWVIKHYKMERGSRWEADGPDEIWQTYLPPIVHAKHLPNPRSWYGMGEFTPSQLDLNDKINLVHGEINRIISYHAAPKTVATGADADDIQITAVDALFSVSNPDAKIYNLEMKSELVSSRDHATQLVETFLAESRVIILKGAVKDFQRVTNAGVRTVFIDQLLKNNVLQWNYGRLLQMITRVAMWLNKKGDRVIPDVVFSDALPIDDTEKINTAALEKQIGVVSRQTLSTKRGYNWESELAKMEEESKLEVFQPMQTGAGGQPGDGSQQPINQARHLQNEPGSTNNK